MYFGGRMLNAGCGNRDITETLRGFGATEVVNYDIASEIPVPGSARLRKCRSRPRSSTRFCVMLCSSTSRLLNR